MTRVTQCSSFWPDVGPKRQFRRRQRGTDHSFFPNMWRGEPHVWEKDQQRLCCQSRVGLPFGQTFSLIVYRVTRVIDRSYAVRTVPPVYQTWKPHSPAAAWYVCSFSINMLHNVQHVYGKAGIFRPAGAESGRLSRQTPGLEPTA